MKQLIHYIEIGSIKRTLIDSFIGNDHKYFKIKSIAYIRCRSVLFYIVIDALHESLNILKITDIYNFELSKFMYLYHTQSLPKIFDPYFLLIAQSHHYNTRSKSNQNYYLNSVGTNSGKKSMKSLGVKMWNQIFPTIKSYTFYRFKKECRHILISKLAQLQSASYRCGRSRVRFPGRSNWRSVANDSPPLRRFFGAVLPRR